MVLTEKISLKKELPVGMIIWLIISILFMTRFVKVALARNIIGNHAYVQMINEGIPILKGSHYNKDAYEESTVTIGSLLMETLYIDKINPESILAKQVTGFSGFVSNSGLVKENNSKNSFVLNEESINNIKVSEDAGQAENSVIDNNSNKSDLNGVRNPAVVKTLDQSRPEVLLYSTHSNEAYTDKSSRTESSGDVSNKDIEKNVLGVGALVEKELEEYYGISVIHDKTIYSTDYNSAYRKSREGVQSYLNKYGDFKVIVDLHRDSGPAKDKVTASSKGENVAKLLFVTGKNNPHYTDTKALINRFDEDIKKFFPELHRGILERNRATSNSYNQDLSKNALLIEVGADKNTAEEAMNTAKYVARLIAEEVNRKNS